MTYRTGTAGLAVTLLVTGCGSTTTTTTDGSDPAQLAGAGTVNCGGSEYEPADLADAPPLSSLPGGPAAAVDDAGQPAFDPAQDWKVVHQSDDRVDLVRELDEPPDHGEGDVRTHESRTLERVTGASNVPDGTWLLTSAGPCSQRFAAGDDLGTADLTLADVPSPDDTSIEVLVHERACASGQSAEGRIELVDLNLTGEQVQVHVGVRPIDGNVTCQGNPPTSFIVDLGEPIGEREIVDVSVVPQRPVTVDDTE